MGISDKILGNPGTQPKQIITAPPFSGPGSGHVAFNVPGTIKARPTPTELCVDLPAFLERAQYRSYVGAAATAIGSSYNYAYALADTVPQGRYWVILAASAAVLFTGSEAYPGLWILPPGLLPAPNNAPYQDNPLVFANEPGTIVGSSANGPPVINGIRVDEADVVSMEDGDGIKKFSDCALLRTKRLIVPQGWTAMLYGGGSGFGTGGGLGDQFRLNILFAEFLLRESSEIS